MDQPGSGQSSVLTDPLNDGDVQPKAPVANALSPVYCWGNTVETNGGTPVSTGCTSTSDSIVIGRDVINGTVKPGYTSFTYPHPLVSGTVIVPSPVRSIILSWTNNGGDGFTIQRKDGHCLVPGTFTDLIHVTNASHQDKESPFPYACYHVRATLAGAPDSVDSNDDGSYLPMKTAPLRGLRRR
jgi:hypothetical protein